MPINNSSLSILQREILAMDQFLDQGNTSAALRRIRTAAMLASPAYLERLAHNDIELRKAIELTSETLVLLFASGDEVVRLAVPDLVALDAMRLQAIVCNDERHFASVVMHYNMTNHSAYKKEMQARYPMIAVALAAAGKEDARHAKVCPVRKTAEFSFG